MTSLPPVLVVWVAAAAASEETTGRWGCGDKSSGGFPFLKMIEEANIVTISCDAYDCDAQLVLGGNLAQAEVTAENEGWSGFVYNAINWNLCKQCHQELRAFLFGENGAKDVQANDADS